jgi:hypothetical protein
LGTRGVVAILFIALSSVACGGSSTPTAATSPATSPTADTRTAAYVAMVKSYWDGIVAADVSGGIDAASRACLGTITDSASPSVELVQPAACHPYAVANMAVQRAFLNEVENTQPPPRFQRDDTVFESQVPLAIDALQALTSATATGSKQATFDAANTFADIMVKTIVPALDDVDPSTKHY